MSQKEQMKLIDENPQNILCINSDELTDETILYALSKYPVLGNVKKERRTQEICEFALKCYPSSLRHVPDEIKTYEMCLNAIMKDPRIIKYVPIRFITEDFVEEISHHHNVSNILCLEKYRDYINEGIKTNKIINSEIDLNCTDEEVIDPKYMEITLLSEGGFFTQNALKLLNCNGINTLYDLFKVSKNSDFYLAMLDNDRPVYREIRAAIRLLKCKYMGTDPLISFDDDRDISDIFDALGLSIRSQNRLMRAGYSKKDIYELVHYEDARNVILYRIKETGKVTYEEIALKTQIVFDYNKAKKEDKSDDLTLEELEEEYKRLTILAKNVDNRIKEIAFKIQEKKNNKVFKI